MLFYTPEFFGFALVLFGVLAVVTRHAPRKLVLLAASYAFYMWWNPAFILLICFSTAVDFVLGRHIEQTGSPRRRTAALVVSLVSNLGLLAWFKYANFFGSGMFAGLRLLGCDVHWVALNVTLPVGMNFALASYTFSHGGVLFDPTFPAEDVTADIHTMSFGYARAIDIFGRSGSIALAIPYTIGDISGLYLGEPTNIRRSGLMDPVSGSP